MSLIPVNDNFKMWSFYWTCLVTVWDHDSNEGGYTLGHRKLRNFFLKENGWSICKLTLTNVSEKFHNIYHNR